MANAILSTRPYSSLDVLAEAHPPGDNANALAIVLTPDGKLTAYFATEGEWVDGQYLSNYPYVKYGWGGAGVETL